MQWGTWDQEEGQSLPQERGDTGCQWWPSSPVPSAAPLLAARFQCLPLKFLEGGFLNSSSPSLTFGEGFSHKPLFCCHVTKCRGQHGDKGLLWRTEVACVPTSILVCSAPLSSNRTRPRCLWRSNTGKITSVGARGLAMLLGKSVFIHCVVRAIGGCIPPTSLLTAESKLKYGEGEKCHYKKVPNHS